MVVAEEIFMAASKISFCTAMAVADSTSMPALSDCTYADFPFQFNPYFHIFLLSLRQWTIALMRNQSLKVKSLEGWDGSRSLTSCSEGQGCGRRDGVAD
ncbi:Hypothetical predicted protein [Prunus dulcis]|uniref:Uncharacterized protein n=1 Tax=Prunus dulcis TaxID=3755 RepID=A0A5E4FQZ0_PRUDU|nr:Hypothetical predicted protein [Prunus dulcis]